MLGSLILYLKGMRIMMFQLSGFYCKSWGFKAPESVCWSLGVAPNTKGLGCGAAYVMRIFGFRGHDLCNPEALLLFYNTLNRKTLKPA